MVRGALTGRRYGLIVVSGVLEQRSSGELRYECRCDCGQRTAVWGSNLRSGHTTSCGDQRRHAAILSQLVAYSGMRPPRPTA